MIYMVDHVFADAELEPEWHEWYAAYLKKLVAVPGLNTAQRFKMVGATPSRYLAMYSIDSGDVYESEPYKKMGGGGSQSKRFHPAYRLWIRNLFDGATGAPAVKAGQRVLVWDRDTRDVEGPLGSRATWLQSVGLHMTTKYRALVVLDAGEAAPAPPGSRLYDTFTPVITNAGAARP
jgi:hypothetical protein